MQRSGDHLYGNSSQDAKSVLVLCRSVSSTWNNAQTSNSSTLNPQAKNFCPKKDCSMFLTSSNPCLHALYLSSDGNSAHFEINQISEEKLWNEITISHFSMNSAIMNYDLQLQVTTRLLSLNPLAPCFIPGVSKPLR